MPENPPKRIIRGTAPAPEAGAPARYTVKNPSPQAQLYYQNALPAMKQLIGGKHDEVYTDPATGRQCTANSCLSFAGTVLEKATGTAFPRTKGNLYNPEFTRTSEQQGWVRVPLNEAQTGDRLQRWVSNVNPQDPAAVQQQVREHDQMRMADLADRQYIQGKYPAHMMVLSAPLRSLGENRPYYGEIVQDGHEFTAADRAKLYDVDDKNYVAYRYIGTGAPAKPAPPPATAAATRTIRGTASR